MKGDGDMKTINGSLTKTPLIENDDFVIYGGKDLENFKVSLIEKLSLKKAGILKFFGLDNFPKVQINLFSDHDDYL